MVILRLYRVDVKTCALFYQKNHTLISLDYNGEAASKNTAALIPQFFADISVFL